MCCCLCDCFCCDCILVIIAFFLPPLPVALKRGFCSCDFLINICLCLLGYVPGLIHSWYIILSNPDPKNYYDEERQIFIALPPNQNSNNSPGSTPQIFINQQPDQTRIRFSHPEPFLESQNHLYKKIDSNGQVSPLSNSPLLNNSHLISKPHVSSPLSNPVNYGLTENNSNDFTGNEEEPPSYENVMNETSKQFK